MVVEHPVAGGTRYGLPWSEIALVHKEGEKLDPNIGHISLV